MSWTRRVFVPCDIDRHEGLAYGFAVAIGILYNLVSRQEPWKLLWAMRL